MDGSERRSSQQSATLRAHAQSRSDSAPSMSLPTLSRRLDATFDPSRNDVRRYPAGHHYDSGYMNSEYHDQPYGSYPIQPGITMQGVQETYSPFMHDGGRAQHHSPAFDHSQFLSYSAGSMLPPLQQTAVFEPISQLHPRQSSVLGVTSDNYVLPPYVPSNAQGSANLSATSSQYVPSNSEQSNYPSEPICRPEAGQAMHPSATMMLSMANANQQLQPLESQHLNMHENHNQFPAQSESQQASEVGMHDYDRQLQVTFEAIIAGRLNDASRNLLAVSRWLLTSIVRLGLQHDSEDERDQRLTLWQEFNHCWEALAQKQKSAIEMENEYNRASTDKLDAQQLRQMVDELVSLCDRIEHFGLVDYEMGVWEDQIVTAFIQCLELLEQKER